MLLARPWLQRRQNLPAADMRYLKGFLIVLYLASAAAWIFDIWSLRQALPSYVVWAGAIGTAYLLPKANMQPEGEPTFARWLLDNFAFFGVVFGVVLFGIASGLVFDKQIELNFVAKLGMALAVAGAWSNFIPRGWFRAPTRRRKSKD